MLKGLKRMKGSGILRNKHGITVRAKHDSGQVAILLAIVLMALIFLAGVLVDVSRISSGEALVEKSVDSAARSALADFSTRLKSGYGIFALNESSGKDVEEEVRRQLETNLTKEGIRSLDFYDFRIESVEVTPVFNLTENQALRRQILEYMKYRAPKELVEGFIERLKAVRETGKMSAIYQKKVGVDKLLGRMDKFQQKLKKCLDGKDPTDRFGVNSFGRGDLWPAAMEQLKEAVIRYGSVNARIQEIDALLDGLERQKADAKKKKDKKAAGKIELEIGRLVQEKSSLVGNMNGLKQKLDRMVDDLLNIETRLYKGANQGALDAIKCISDIGNQITGAIAELDSFIKSLTETGSLLEQLKSTIQGDMDKTKGLVLSGQKAVSVTQGLEQNLTVLGNLEAALDSFRGILRQGEVTVQSADDLSSNVFDMIRKYGKVDYDYVKPAKEHGKEDPRKEKAEEAQGFLEKILQDKNYRDWGVREEELPSRNKVESKEFVAEDAPYLVSERSISQTGHRTTAEQQYPGDLGQIGREADLYNEDGLFQENALGLIAGIGDLLAGDLSRLRDDIYINEYIMGSFKNAVPVLRDGLKEIPDTGLSGLEKAKRETRYDAETEYILHGDASQNVNNLKTRGEILLIRFGLDTLHVYMDGSKKELATGIAAAVAGWWTGGAGIPVLSNLIMCGWGLGEAVIDMSDLLEGKQVPIYKSQGDWKLSIGLPKKKEPRTDARLAFNYHDYLRLLLLTVPEESKLSRIEDLIQMNLQMENPDFKMSGCHTFIRVEAAVSMKYLFVTKAFMSAQVKTGDGRHRFKVLVYSGYQ